MNWYPILWLIAAIVLALAELASVQLVSIWFALGAVVAMLASLLRISFYAQLVVFVVVSAAALAVTRPLVKRTLDVKKTRTNLDRAVGQTGIVETTVDNRLETGRILVDGMSWSARSESGEPIEPGTTVEVVRMEGVKLIVRRK